MRLQLMGAVVCLTLAYCFATPITIINAGHQGPQTELKIERNSRKLETENVPSVQEKEKQSVLKKDESVDVLDKNESVSDKEPSQSEKGDLDSKKEAISELPTEKKDESKISKKAISPKKSHHKVKASGRQSSDDDEDYEEDDDDDDDDLGLGLGDESEDEDDDDDEDEGETNDTTSDNETGNVRDEEDEDDDDEEEDYGDFERFFEDILGGGGDDDDDDDGEDDISPSTGDNEVVANAVAPSKPQVEVLANSNVAPVATNVEEANPTEQLNAAGELDESGTDTPIGESLIETDPIDDEPVPIVQNSVQDPVIVDPVPADEPVNDNTDNDEDDDDDSDSDEADDDDDDDDEDDEDDEDDDDEDDDDLTAAIEARNARSAKPALPKMPPVYTSKYNRFADAVINRINRVLGKQYDPVRVKLLSNLKKNNQKKTVTKNTKKNQAKKGQKRENQSNSEQLNKMGELELARSKYETVVPNNPFSPRVTESESREPAFVLVSRVGSTSDSTTASTLKSRTTPGIKSTPTKSKKHKTKSSTKASNKNQVKQSTPQNKEKARATLFGLSSIKREGDVVVQMTPDYTMVKTNFILGPLTLRVERELARSGKRVLRSATATTAEMFGKMNLKIIPGGTATLTSMRVLQPKQVRIDSSDDHDKTRKFMWKKSPEIANMVSQKLTAATRSMLQPPPQTRP